MTLNSLQFRDGTMNADDVAALGAATAAGIPLTRSSTAAVLTTSVVGKNMTVSWPAAITGFILESTVSLASPNWLTSKLVDGPRSYQQFRNGEHQHWHDVLSPEKVGASKEGAPG